MTTHHRIRKAFASASVLVLAGCLAGCELGPQDLPSPNSSIGSAYPIRLVFANALNLPNGANVTLDGLRVGVVEEIEDIGTAVAVSARISDGTRIPRNAQATLRQDTVLGDTYVAIESDLDEPAQGGLPVEGEIPLAQTTSPPQLEDTLAVLANFVNGGNIQKIETSIRKLNGVTPDGNELRRLASTVAVDLQDVAARTGHIDDLIAGLKETSAAVSSRSTMTIPMLSSSGVDYWDRLFKQIVKHIGTLLPSVGSIFTGGSWMVPMLVSADRALAATGLSVIPDEMKTAEFVRSKLVPFVQHPSINVVAVTTPDGQHFRDIENLLRMLGVSR